MTSCSNDDEPVNVPNDAVESQLQKMTLREKVGQMFFVRMESLDTTVHWNTYAELQQNPMQELNSVIRGLNVKYPVGGIILYEWNINNEPQLAKLL